MSSSLFAFAFAVLATGSDSVRADRDVRLTALRNARDVHRCYVDEGLRRQPALEGVVEVELTIQPTGVVSEVKVSTATLDGPGAREAAACIATTVRHWRFGRGPYDVEIVIFPFVLRREAVKEDTRAV